jgi:hypothetical protein
MKRILAAIAFALAVVAGVQAFAAGSKATSLDGLKTAFADFAGPMAGGITIDSTAGNNWSDAWIGSFPHYGVGIATGVAFIGIESASSLFKAMGTSFPSELNDIGLPLPTVVGTLKIGLPFLPMDIGIKGGYLPATSLKELLEADATGNYANIGIQLRYALVKQSDILPNVSVGAAYDYQKAGIRIAYGKAQSYIYGPATVNATQPVLFAGWDSSTVDFTAQVSKRFFFIIPYLGAGCTLGASSVNGGVESTITTDYPGGIDKLNEYLATIGGPTLSSAGFDIKVAAADPLVRLYGGFSLRAGIFDIIDIQALYVPLTGAFGASFTTRLQF